MSLVECQVSLVKDDDPLKIITNELLDLASDLAELIYDGLKADSKIIELQFAKLAIAVNSIPPMHSEEVEKWTQTLESFKKSMDKGMKVRKAEEKTIKFNHFKMTFNELKNFLQAETVAMADLCIDWGQIDKKMITIMTASNEVEQLDNLNDETTNFLVASVEHVWLLYHQLKEREKFENQPKMLTCSGDQQQQKNPIKMDVNSNDSITPTFFEPSIKSDDLPLTFQSIGELTTDLQNFVSLIELLLTLRPLDINFIESTISNLNLAIEKIPHTETELARDYTEKTVNLMGLFITLQEEGEEQSE